MRLSNSADGSMGRSLDLAAWAYAHRGLWRPEGPSENSLGAVQAARALGLGVEIDVTITREGEVVVFHDRDLHRMTGVRERVCDLDLTDLRALTLPDGAHIPTLRETAGNLSDPPTLIELKSHTDPERLVHAVSRVLPSFQSACAVMSFDREMVTALRNAASERPVGLLIDTCSPEDLAEAVDWAQAKGLDFLGPHLSHASSERLLNQSLPCVIWTIRREQDLPVHPQWAPIFEMIDPSKLRRTHDG